MIKAVIWDIDGTLLDSEPLHLEALLTVCARYDVDISDLPKNHFIGVNLCGVWRDLSERFPENLSMGHWIDELNAVYAANAAKLIPIDGAQTVVRTLAIHGYRQAAVSNSNRAVVETNLTMLKIGKLLSFSISLDDVLEGKPSPIPYLQALDQLHLAPHEVIAIEDSKTGVLSAKAAKIRVLGLGPNTLAADQPIQMLSEIPKALGIA